MTPLDIEDRRDLHRRASDSQSLGRSIGIALAVTSLASSLFIAGYNWRSVAIVEMNQDNFVRKDVQYQQMQNTNDRLSEISKQLEELRSEIRTQRRKE